jgi:hypothetical protein
MARPARVVEHLRLRGESESAVRHALPALEDAFRTASLPGAGARLVCVRRLQLGRLPSNGSAQSVALLIEKRFAEAGWTIVHAGENGAATADAVWFRDAFEAHDTAALRLAAGQTLDAWFWPLALPKVVTPTGSGNLRTIAFAIAAMEEAPRALPAWTASLVLAGYRQQLISALRPGDGHALLRAAGVPSLPPEHASSASVTSHESRDPRVPRAAVDDRATFVEVIAGRSNGRLPQLSTPIAAPPATRATRSAGGITAPPDAAARASVRRPPRPQPAGAHESVSHQGSEPAGNRLIPSAETNCETARNELAQGGAPAAIDDRLDERRAASSPDAPPEQTAAPAGQGPRPEDAGATHEAADAPVAFTSPWQLPSAAPTAAGGLLFLLPVLERVGFAEWAADRGPEEPAPELLAAQILHLLLTRLRVEEDDPVWGIAPAFRLNREATELASAEDLSGSQLQPDRPSDLGGFRLQPDGSIRATAWLTRCRRYLRRRARIGLASLIVRPARVAITPTHVDMFFRLNAADVRVRRAGLDIDPGWVPWFGRVVTFHYEDRPWN